MNCRHCNNSLRHVFLDLAFAPPSNAYLTETDLNKPERYFPLKLFVCEQCWLVQTEDFASAEELFGNDYAYYSSVSSSWLDHAKKYFEMIRDRLRLNETSFVVEIASNDGYLLKNFVNAGIPSLGIEPTGGTAAAAEKAGVEVLGEFFGEDLAGKLALEGKGADLIIGNNVYAHVPDINDFTRGLKRILKPHGTITLEFPHLLQLIRHKQFDTVYHEHYSYLSLHAVRSVFQRAGLEIYNVEELSTHGGSLRIYGSHKEDEWVIDRSVESVLEQEKRDGLLQLTTYTEFQKKADRVKNDLLKFLISQQESGKLVAAYGAAAKGNTLLNYAGVKPDLLPVVYDAAPSKQNKYLPGSHIPIKNPDQLHNVRPDYILILPWNIQEEVILQLAELKNAGSRFAVAVPELKIL
jgi:SAM-dependent methyltransferase